MELIEKCEFEEESFLEDFTGRADLVLLLMKYTNKLNRSEDFGMYVIIFNTSQKANTEKIMKGQCYAKQLLPIDAEGQTGYDI